MNKSRQTIHPQTKSINVQEVKLLLKDCPKEVKNYVRALEDSLEVKEGIIKKAIAKIKELSR